MLHYINGLFKMKGTIVVTFCECGENHDGMEMEGKRAGPGEGCSLYDLQKACQWCKRNDVKYELWDLRPEGVAWCIYSHHERSCEFYMRWRGIISRIEKSGLG